jgi:methyl acetate hydrolase
MRAQFGASNLANTVVGFVTRGGAQEFVAMGSLSVEDATPVNPDTLYDIASMTKAITATAALQLVEQGKLSLDEPLEEVLPELRQIQILEEDGSRRAPRRSLTLRDLLRHTSGFAYFFNTPRVAAELEFDPVTNFPKPETLEDGVYDWGFDVQPRRVFDAGERWCYGRGVGVAGRVIERVSGLDLDTYFKRHIFTPLGMTRSGYNLPPALMRDRAALHARDPATGKLAVMPETRPAPMERFYGGGSLLSTPRDYATFLRCLLNGGALDGVRVLGAEMVALMTSDQLPAGVRVDMDPLPGAQDGDRRSFVSEYDDGYSLAWAIEVGAEDGRRPEGVGYWSGIFNTYYTLDPVRGVAIMSFSQLMPFDDAEAYELYRRYEDAIYGVMR